MFKTTKAPSLQRRIQIFGASMIVMILLVSGLLGLAALRSMVSYQQIMNQMVKIQQVKAEISTVGQLIQDHVVSNENNLEECLKAWRQVNAEIMSLDFSGGSRTAELLALDLQAYQKNTSLDFYNMVAQESESQQISAYYENFLTQQEDRQFLCDQMLKYLTEHMTNRYSDIVRENAVSLLLIGAIVVCLLVLTGVFSYNLGQNIYQPVQTLTEQAGKIMQGDYQMEDLPVVQEDEIGRLTEAFNEMKKRVRENFRNQEELFRLEALLKDAEFRALQSQVNPHFLFNVLSVATEAALLENADRTVDIIENISYMLHYGLTSVRENSWLKDELRMVRAYLFLQQKRFGERIKFQLSVPEEPILLRIPGMTLQPIVENAVRHGVERLTTGGEIAISMQQTREAVEICVADNGCGMTQEQVEALNSGKSIRGDGSSTGLGIANVQNRMAIFYGQSGLLRVESRKNEGTRVYLKYLIQGEAEHVSDTDCR